jgi:TRAP-type C4-dicarboxylate transport system permease small subunit
MVRRGAHAFSFEVRSFRERRHPAFEGGPADRSARSEPRMMVRRMIRIANGIGGFFIVLMMLHIVVDVFSMWLFNHPILGTLEIVSNYYMVAVIFFPLAFVQLNKKHISAELLSSLFGRTGQRILDVILYIVTSAYCGLFAWQSAVVALESTRKHEFVDATGYLITIWPSRWVLPLGFAAMAIVALVQAFSSHDDAPSPSTDA